MTKRGRKVQKETPKANDKKGYLDSNKDAFTDYKVIQGNKITMEGVSGKIYAIPIDSKGRAGQGRLMKAGENHTFDGAAHVIEIPETAMAQAGVGGTKNLGITGGIDVNPQYSGFGKPVLDWIQTTGNSLAAEFEENFAENRALGTKVNDWFSSTPPPTSIPATTPVASTPPYVDTNNIPQYGQQPTSGEYQQTVPYLTEEQLAEQKKLQGYEQDAEGQLLADNTQDTQDFVSQLTNQTKSNVPAEGLLANYESDIAEIAPENVTEGLEETEKIQFSNPYGGVDIPTAAMTLGSSLSYKGDQKGANVARGVASGLKLLTGLGRNVMSGYAQNKRNQWVLDEYNQKQKNALKKNQYLQQGGITTKDVSNINDSTGIDFTHTGANALFDINDMSLPTEGAASVLDFGRYKDVGYFEEGEMQNGKRIIYNTDRNPMNLDDNKRNALRYLQEINDPNSFEFRYREKRNAPIVNQSVASMQKGGKISAAELLTGTVVTGDPLAPHNVEVEGGEHIKNNQTGQVQEVLGNKHTSGGEKMNLEDHKVLSDYTKIGGDLAKKYRDEYDIKVKAKDTYATVMDKVLKKTGYKSITDELTSTIEKTEKEQEKSKERDSEATTGINMQFLSGKIHELSKELEPLESLKSSVFENLFADQQGSKTKSELMEEGELMQDGGESRKRFKTWVENLRVAGFDGEVNLDAEDLNAEAAKLQAWMRKNRPETVINYFTEKGQPITAKGVELIKQNNPEIFEQLGIDSSKPSASYTKEEKEELRNLMKKEGLYTNDFILEQFNDNKFEFRAPLVDHSLDMQPIEGIAPQFAAPTTQLRVPSLATETIVEDEPDGKKKLDGNGKRIALLPDQHILPPSAMQPHRLAEITPREAEAKLISPITQIEEINRQFMTAKAEINSLPDTQRRAALAQLNAQTQQSINQVMSQTNRANAQIEGQNEERNIQRGTQADIFNEDAANLFEQNQLIAKDKTEQEIRNYFNAQNRKQIANYNTIQNMNLTNAMYDNFQYDGMGSIIQTGKAPDMIPLIEQVMAAQKEEEEDKKTTKKAKRGRKIK